MCTSQQASLLKVSPTAIGLMSGANPSSFLFSAIRLPPAKDRDTEVGALPAARVLMTNLREVHMGVGRGMLATSSRCSLREQLQCLWGMIAGQRGY